MVYYSRHFTMSYSILNRFAVSAIAVGFFFLGTPSAHGATFTLPSELKHEGLTFSPASFDRQLHLPTKYTHVSFNTAKKLAIKSEKHQKKEVEAIVITPPQQKITPDATIMMPTPTIYRAPEKAVQARNDLTIPTPTAAAPTPTKPLSTPTTIQATATTVPTNNGGLNPEKLFTMANNYRQSKGLAPLEKDERACTLAASRAPEINAEVAEGRMHSGLKARNLPYWNTENIITMNSEEAAFNWWINDTIHREAIEGNYKYSCVACSGNACAQEFTNFQPK